MDPLSISASIAGLVALADLVFRYSTKYLNGARKEAEDISHEVKNLSLILHNLSHVAFELEETLPSGGTQQTSNLKLHHLHDCQQLLRRLEQGLVEKQLNLSSTSRIERLQSRFAWPFSSSDTKDILRNVRRHKQNIELALEADSFSNLRLLLSRQSESNSTISNVQGTINKIYDIQTSIRSDEKRKKVLEFFTKVNPSSELNNNRDLRHNQTGLWLTKGPEFEEWYTTPGSKIWCSGIPGAGKSVLAAAMIDECLKRNAANPCSAMAYFFCIYRDEKTQGPASILSSLCSQLARQDEKAFLVLEEYYHELTSERQPQSGPSTKKLVKVLQRMCYLIDRVYIIVDGLDECGKQVEASVESLAALLPYPNDKTLNLALLSRDEVPIREILRTEFQNVEIEAQTEDLQRYVDSELERRITSRKLRLRDLSLKDEIRARLCAGAKGMFRWVACQLDHLCELPTDGARRKALAKLPPTLFTTYERILARIDESHDHVKQLVQRTLLLISSPYHAHLSLRQMCEAISLQDGEEELVDEDIVDGEDLLRWCGSLVRTTRTQARDELSIEFSHFSVQEYLQNNCLKHPTLSAYGISRQNACHLLASLCLGHLALKNHERLPDATCDAADRVIEALEMRDSRRPFYRHAATCWPSYVREAGEDCCLDRIGDLFQLPKTPSFCLWVTTLAAHSISVAHRKCHQWLETPGFNAIATFSRLFHVFRPDFTPLHMAALLGMPNLCRHLLGQGANVDAAGMLGTPLHCAIGGLYILVFQDPNVLDPPDMFDDVSQPVGRRQAAQALLEAGAKPQLRYTAFQQESYSSLALVAISSTFEHDLGVAVELIKAGVAVEKEDLAPFQQYYDILLDMVYAGATYSGGHAILGLLQALGPPDTEMEDTPRSSLHLWTLRCARSIGIMASVPVPGYHSKGGMDDDEVIEHITELVEKNNSLKLRQFLEENGGSKLGKSAISNRGWTPLHLAVRHNSLGALNVLLDHGFSANMLGQGGETPLHWCQNEKAFRALLKHGASTILADKAQRTVWHIAAMTDNARILNLIINLNDRQHALQMVSSSQETPICTALNHKNKDAVIFLLNYCNSKESWRSSKPLFRAAAELGSSEVVQHLIDLGIEVDGMDDITGSPLHYLSTKATVGCIQLLKSLFLLDQRRNEDLRTPLELLLLRALRQGEVLDSDVLEAMLPSAAASSHCEASSLWSFISSDMFIEASIDGVGPGLESTVLSLIKFGIMAKYEEEKQESALLPFASILVRNFIKMYEEVWEDLQEPRKYRHWARSSAMIAQILARTSHWDSVVDRPDITGLLSLSILHDDLEMISLLLDKGVSMHSRVGKLSPFEFACFPSVPVGERSFKLLLKHAVLEKMTERNVNFNGYSSLHFIAGLTGKRGTCAWKLRHMLSAGVDPNPPLPGVPSPLAFHVLRNAPETAEILLESGAYPWARGSYPFDAPSLHLAAMKGNTECLEFYLSRGLLPDLECHDDHLQTPMHYAARFGHSSTIQWLKAHGGNINARNRDGCAPLHLATDGGHLKTVRTLIDLGADQQVRNDGGTPLSLAYARGDAAIIQVLETLNVSNSPSMAPRMLRQFADQMQDAILRGDIATCREIHALGCPLNVEMGGLACVTPLMVAICQQDPEIAEWLVDSGATVSTVFPRPYQERYSTTLEAAVAHPRLNSLLLKLLDKYLEEGGSFLDIEKSPLHVAINYNNLEGLEILLGWLRSTDQSSNLFAKNSSRRETLSAFVNQHLSNDDVEGAALHFAAAKNNVDICAALIDSRANIEELDADNRTPLHIAALRGSLQAARYLLDCGARPNPLDAWAETPLMSAYRESQWELVDLLAPYCKEMMRTNRFGQSLLHFMTLNGLSSARKRASSETFSRCLEQGASLYLRDKDGVAPVHWILASQSAHHLRFLLNRDHRFLRPQETAHWPCERFLFDTHKLAAISKNLRLVQPFLSKHELCQISAVAETGNHSLLCRAACQGSVQAIKSLLALRVDMIEHQCNDHGTALTAAVLGGHVKAVKCLVRNGATVPYNLCQPSDFEISMGNPDFVIREWLFVGRHLERRRISNVAAEASDKIESWAGVRTARVALKWEWKRHREESIWDYACRRLWILKDLRGKIVRCAEEDDSGDDASGDAGDNVRDEEFSGRYYCLRQERIRGARLVY